MPRTFGPGVSTNQMPKPWIDTEIVCSFLNAGIVITSITFRILMNRLNRS